MDHVRIIVSVTYHRDPNLVMCLRGCSKNVCVCVCVCICVEEYMTLSDVGIGSTGRPFAYGNTTVTLNGGEKTFR